MATARDLARDDYKVIAVVGDGALTGGMAFEGLNNGGILEKEAPMAISNLKLQQPSEGKKESAGD